MSRGIMYLLFPYAFLEKGLKCSSEDLEWHSLLGVISTRLSNHLAAFPGWLQLHLSMSRILVLQVCVGFYSPSSLLSEILACVKVSGFLIRVPL